MRRLPVQAAWRPACVLAYHVDSTGVLDLQPAKKYTWYGEEFRYVVCMRGAENLIRATHDPCGGKFELGAFSTPNQASSCSSCLRASSEKTKFVDKHLGGGESWRAAPRCHCSAPALSPPLEYLNPTFSSSCLSVQCRCTSTTTRPLFAVSWERPSSTAASPCPPPRGACCNLCRRSYC